jgi:hypothetical protein
MRGTVKIRLVLQLLVVVIMSANVAAQGSPETVVVLAPCRILDSAVTAAQPGREGVRDLEISTTRCGRIVPPYATAYILRVTTTSRTAPDKLPAGTLPMRDTARRVPIAAKGVLSFPVPPASNIAVDLEGYAVPPGTPVNPISTPSGHAARVPEDTTDSVVADGPTESRIVHSGPAGEIYLDASTDPIVGVFMTAAPATPWIVARTGSTDAASGFAIANSAPAELLRVSSNGVMKMASNYYYYDGRTDFFGMAGPAPNNFVSVPTNIIHDVTLTNPRDGNSSNAQRLVFFNAATSDEFGSPAITKFQASTLGYYAQNNVNYDSIFKYHWGEQFHYRARSAAEGTPFDTFWVKAAGADSLTGTRADMFVSGVVGIGALPQPSTARLFVQGDVKVNGKVEATTVVGAVYQDLAEWVPSAEDLEPGTVVVLNPERRNEVVASTRAYDQAVAGVVSYQPGIILGEAAATKEQVATTGRVRVHVDARSVPIAIGDLLVTSDRAGYAMKSIPVELSGIALHRPGTILGKALEPLAGGEGEILVLLSLQ